MNDIESQKNMRDLRHELRVYFCIALAATLCIECLNQRSFWKVFLFIAYRPWMLLFDVLILLDIISLGLLFKRRVAVTSILLGATLLMAFVNFMVTFYRTQPFTTMDFLQIPAGLAIMPVYFNPFQIFLVGAGLAGIAAGIVFLILKAPKRERTHFWAKVAWVVIFTVGLMGINRAAVASGVIERRMENLVEAYQNYGFTYCFVRTFANMGIPKPSGYSGEKVESIVTDLEEESEVQPVSIRASEERPNIIFLQLESHFDVSEQLLEARFSEDPIPTFTRLKRSFPHGALKVPSVGGGTCNTEFEVLSGMNLDYFGAGEYPYNTVLNNTTCESVCYDLRPYDYNSTALHNYLGTFYGRNHIYSQLGFNNFVSMEYMEGLEYNSQGWPKDNLLTQEILDALDSTLGRDFLMTITVQSHGKYAETLPEDQLHEIRVLASPENVDAIQLENFVNELRGVDDFVADLLFALEARDEPTIVVMYGDHLPGLGITPEDMACGDVYQTTYVIWNNFGAKFEAPDLQAYRLTANIMKQLGFDSGLLNRFHQSWPVDEAGEEYMDALEILEYDMLYGDHEATGGEVPYMATNLQLGVKPIRVTGVEADPEKGTLTVTGTNFTEFSAVLLDGQRLETAFVNGEKLIAVPEGPLEGPVRVSVAQFTKENIEMSRTAPRHFTPPAPQEDSPEQTAAPEETGA